MDFSIPADLSEDIEHFREFIKAQVKADLSGWNQKQEIPRRLFQAFGKGGWYGLAANDNRLVKGSALREALLAE